MRRSLLIAEALLLGIGLLTLGWAGYVTGQRLLYSSWQDYRFEQTLEGQEATISGYLRFLMAGRSGSARPADEQPAAAQPPSKSKPKHKVAPNGLIGRIEIPRVKVSAIVQEGVDAATLDRAAGHVPNTAFPGEKGNVGVAAHRDTFFRGLRNIRNGDEIRVTTVEGAYVYKVDSLRIVWPKNVEVLDPTVDSRITLVTCYPFNFVGHAPKRYIVQARQVGFEPLTAEAHR